MNLLLLSWEYPPHMSGGLGQHVKELVPALLQCDPALALRLSARVRLAGEASDA
jgi:hypothetical protein